MFCIASLGPQLAKHLFIHTGQVFELASYKSPYVNARIATNKKDTNSNEKRVLFHHCMALKKQNTVENSDRKYNYQTSQ